MAELLNTKINGTLNVNDYFNIDKNGNLTLKSGNNEIFKIGNDSTLTLKRNGFNLFSIDDNGLNYNLLTNENILNINANGLVLNKGDLTVNNGTTFLNTIDTTDTDGIVNIKKPVNITGALTTSGLITTNGGMAVKSGDFTSNVKLTVNDNITGKSLNIKNAENDILTVVSEKIEINKPLTVKLNGSSFNVKDTNSVLRINKKNAYLNTADIANIDTGFLDINVTKNLEEIVSYGSNEDELGIPYGYNVKTGDYIIANDIKYKVKNVYDNPDIRLYIFLTMNFIGALSTEVPVSYYGDNIKITSEVFDNAIKYEPLFEEISLPTTYRRIYPTYKDPFNGSSIYGIFNSYNNDKTKWIITAEKINSENITEINYNKIILAITNTCDFTTDEQIPIKKYLNNQTNNNNPLVVLTIVTNNLQLLQLDGSPNIKKGTIIYKENAITSDSLGLVNVNGRIKAKQITGMDVVANRLVTQETYRDNDANNFGIDNSFTIDNNSKPLNNPKPSNNYDWQFFTYKNTENKNTIQFAYNLDFINSDKLYIRQKNNETWSGWSKFCIYEPNDRYSIPLTRSNIPAPYMAYINITENKYYNFNVYFSTPLPYENNPDLDSAHSGCYINIINVNNISYIKDKQIPASGSIKDGNIWYTIVAICFYSTYKFDIIYNKSSELTYEGRKPIDTQYEYKITKNFLLIQDYSYLLDN